MTRNKWIMLVLFSVVVGSVGGMIMARLHGLGKTVPASEAVLRDEKLTDTDGNLKNNNVGDQADEGSEMVQKDKLDGESRAENIDAVEDDDLDDYTPEEDQDDIIEDPEVEKFQ